MTRAIHIMSGAELQKLIDEAAQRGLNEGVTIGRLEVWFAFVRALRRVFR